MSKWALPSGGFDSIVVTVQLPVNEKYRVKFRLGSNQAKWGWTSIKRGNQLIARESFEGQTPKMTIASNGNLSVSDYLMMGTSEHSYERVEKFEAPAHSDLSRFWTDFKAAAAAKDYASIQRMTKFPFYSQYTAQTETEFKEFTFSGPMLSGLRNAPLPSKSAMSFGGYPSGNLAEVQTTSDGYPYLYFIRINTEWKFVGVVYGE